MSSGYLVRSSASGPAGCGRQNLSDPLTTLAHCPSRALHDLAAIDGPFLAAAVNPVSTSATFVRDKFGLRPLYYRLEPHRLCFADDVRILLHLTSQTAVRTLGLIEWMHYGVALEPFTMFRDVYALRPGHALVYDWSRGTVSEQRYFDPRQYVSPSLAESLASKSAAQLEESFECLLRGAVARSTEDQSAVTVLVSGGVDSSLVAALATERAQVTAVTVDVQGPGAESELPYATAVAQHLKLRHRVCRFTPTEFRDTLCDSIHVLGTPIIIENAVALLHASLSGAIPRGQLILDGEGGDALFCGSTPLFKYSMLTMIAASLSRLPTKAVRRGLEVFRRKLAYLGLSTCSTLDSGGLDMLLGARRMEMRRLTDDLLASFSHLPDLAEREIYALTLREFYDYLVPLMLRIDRMAQAAQTHAVLPFLDGRVFRFAENLPMSSKIRWSWRQRRPITKWLLKRVTSRYVPRQLVYRPKGGFGIPGGRWIGSLPQAWLANSWVCEHFGLEKETLQGWLQSNPASRDRMFLITLEIWGRLFDRRVPLEEVRSQWLCGSAT